ncbi:unnamed protein product [Adineta steineri]|uniref:Bromo domain-containing protein n=1 Tax=Adineta steineri TaxID=433720 RepID=A0A815F7W2_9BILA|nr:unnamed protein product [Adineta steineri]
MGRQTSRSTNTSANATNNSTLKSRQPSISSTTSVTNTNGDSLNNSSSSNRNRSNNTNNNNNNNNNNRKSKPRNSSHNIESSVLQESHSNSSHTDAITMSSLNESSSIQSPLNTADIDDDDDDNIPSPTMGGTNNNNNNNNNTSKKKPSRKSKTNTDNNDIKACRNILNELLKNDASWPFQTPVDAKQHPEYYECIKTPMDFSTMKKKMRNHQYTKRDEFFNDVQLILNNCEYYNEDDSPVGEAGHVLRTFFETRWAKQFGDNQLNRCEHCGKLFHEECLKNAKQQRGKWLCVLCTANDSTALIASLTAGNNNTKWQMGRQTSRSTNTSANATNNSTLKSRQPSISSTTSVTNTNGDSLNNSSSSNRNRSNNTNNNNNNNNRKSKPRNSSHNIESSILQESHSNSSHTDAITMSSLNESSSVQSPLNTADIDDDDDNIPSPTMGGTNNNNNNNTSKKKPSRKSKTNTDNNDIKACRNILNELLKNDASWPFQTPVDAKQHPEYYECIKTPMDFSTMKKKMRNHQYTKRDEFFNDVQLILNNCEYYNEDDSPVGEAGHVLRTFFETRWAKQFG